MAAARALPLAGTLRHEMKRLRKSIGAMSIIGEENGHAKLGIFMDLAPGLEVEVRGTGFTTNTVRVRAQGHEYYVLRKSLFEQ